MNKNFQKQFFWRLCVYIYCINGNDTLLCKKPEQCAASNKRETFSTLTDGNYSLYAEPLSTWYQIRTKKILDFNNPVTFNEKIQWLKLYDATPIKTLLADKYLVKQWIKEKIGEQYVVPLLGVWDNFDDIDFSSLPKQFVLKVNNGSKRNIFVHDKSLMNQPALRKKITKWIRKNYAYESYEMHYADIKSKIIAEQFIEVDGCVDGQLCEYSVFCFNGHPRFIVTNMVIQGQNTDRHNVYDLQWNFQPFTLGYQNTPEPENKPAFLEELIRLSTILCAGFKFVRVDFFHTKSNMYFGEMTFTPRSGLSKIIPQEYDRILGDLIDLSL